MKQSDKNREANKDIDVSRSERQQASHAAQKGSATGQEQRAEGSKGKGNPSHNHSSHKEGQSPYQSDDLTMNPSGDDSE